MKTGIVFVLFAGMCLVQVPNGTRQVPDEEHVKQLILSLPPDSQTRQGLERGARGDGIHHAWMDHMKKRGVQRVRVFLEFAWKDHPVDIRVRRIAFFKTYDDNCAQILDSGQLQLIEVTGLEKELEEFAVAQTAKSHWIYIDQRPRASRGTAVVDLVDDEWLPLLRPNLMPVGDKQRLPEITIDGDVRHLQETLGSAGFSQDELDGALIETSGYLDDECFMKPLLSAGANPNVRNADGETPLMFAATSGHIHSVEALLKAGADPEAKNYLGETAQDMARMRGYPNVALRLQRKL